MPTDTRRIVLELMPAQAELVHSAVSHRAEIWERTAEYLAGRHAEGEIEECHDLEEAEAMAKAYRELAEQIERRRGE